jgi:serine/threonine protein kinase
MAPERLMGQADARSDQFSFAVTLYRALFGQHPFEGGTQQEVWARIARQQVRRPPEDSQVPALVFEVIARALHANPEARYPSMGALLDDLDDAAKPTVLARAARSSPKPALNVARLGVIGGSLAALVMGLIFANNARSAWNSRSTRSGEVARSSFAPTSTRADSIARHDNSDDSILRAAPQLSPEKGRVLDPPTSSRTRPSRNAAESRSVARNGRKRSSSVASGSSARTERSHKRAIVAPPGEDDESLKPLDEEQLWRGH